MRAERSRVLAELWGRAGPRLALATVLLAGACGGGGTGATRTPATASPIGPTQIGIVRVWKFECTLEGVSGPIGAGDVAVAVVNETGQAVYVNMIPIPEGHSYEELAANIEKARKSARQGGPVVPHLEWLPLSEALTVTVPAGESGSMTGSVDPGTYGIACLRIYPELGVPRPNGVFGPVKVE